MVFPNSQAENCIQYRSDRALPFLKAEFVAQPSASMPGRGESSGAERPSQFQILPRTRSHGFFGDSWRRFRKDSDKEAFSTNEKHADKKVPSEASLATHREAKYGESRRANLYVTCGTKVGNIYKDEHEFRFG